MKYNDNGEIKNIVVKAADSLPVGTIVEYDGDSIPAGYEEIDVGKIRKTYQGVVPTGKVLNSESSSLNDTYSCDYINEKFNDIETIDISNYKTNNIQSITRATITRSGNIYHININCASIITGSNITLFSNIPLKPNFTTELSFCDINGKAYRCILDTSGNISVAKIETTDGGVYINGVVIK